MGADATVYDKIDPAITSFVGYDKRIRYSAQQKEVVDHLRVQHSMLLGQEGDKGVIKTSEGNSLLL